MIKEDLNKVIEMQEEVNTLSLFIHKPYSKNKIKVYDSDNCAFDIVEDKLLFSFWDYKDFSVKLNSIVSVIFEKFSKEMTIVHVKLKNKNTIMLHFVM